MLAHAIRALSVSLVALCLVAATSGVGSAAEPFVPHIDKVPCDRNDVVHVVMHFWGNREEHCWANDGVLNVDWPDVTFISSGNNYVKVIDPDWSCLSMPMWDTWNAGDKNLQVKYFQVSRNFIPC